MSRGVVLFLALAFSLVTMLVTLVLVPFSGPQMSRRLKAEWELGVLSTDKARLFSIGTGDFDLDLKLVSFESLKIKSKSSNANVLSLGKVQWRRKEALPSIDRLHVADSTFWFERGVLQVELRDTYDGYSANYDAIFSGQDGWAEELPLAVAGHQLSVRATRRSSSHGEEHLAVEFLDPEFLRTREGLHFKARLRDRRARGAPGGSGAEGEDPGEAQGIWTHGKIDWALDSGGAVRYAVLFDDADLELFPFRALSRIGGLPWQADIPALRGRAFLEWTRDGAATKLRAEHFRLDLSIPGLAHELTSLHGRATLEKNVLSWKIESGIYSHSDLRSPELSIDFGQGTLAGEIELAHFLADRDLEKDLPSVWRELWKELAAGGDATLRVRLQGSLATPFAELLSHVDLRMERVTLFDARSADGITGRFDLARGASGWRIRGTTADSTCCGLRVQAGDWQGAIEGGRVYLERVRGDDGIDIRLRAQVLEDRQSLEFEGRLQGASLSTLLDLPLGDARADLEVNGRWHCGTQQMLSCKVYASWKGMTPAQHLPWPYSERSKGGPIDGNLRLVWDGQGWTVSWVRAISESCIWVAQGTSRRGRWKLEAAFLTPEPGESAQLPFPADLPELIRQAPECFHLEGGLLAWPVPVR